jgi:hypothetical protein
MLEAIGTALTHDLFPLFAARPTSSSLVRESLCSLTDAFGTAVRSTVDVSTP